MIFCKKFSNEKIKRKNKFTTEAKKNIRHPPPTHQEERHPTLHSRALQESHPQDRIPGWDPEIRTQRISESFHIIPDSDTVIEAGPDPEDPRLLLGEMMMDCEAVWALLTALPSKIRRQTGEAQESQGE